MDKPRRVWPWIVATLIGAPLLHVASLGPACCPVDDGALPETRGCAPEPHVMVNAPGEAPRDAKLIPISPYFDQSFEDPHFEKRVARLLTFDSGDQLGAPSQDEILRLLPETSASEIHSRNNVRIVVELIVDRLSECRFYPTVGPARHRKRCYKCTVAYDKRLSDGRSSGSEVTEVVYIDRDRLIHCDDSKHGGNQSPE